MSTKALIVVDIQNEYFPQGKLSLVGINEAADNAALVIESAREKAIPSFMFVMKCLLLTHQSLRLVLMV